jgi:AraC-like DNA-binding protein
MEMPEDGVWWLNYSQYEDLRLYEIGIQRCAPSYSFGPIIRDRYILHYVFEGEGVLRIDDKELKVKSNSFFLLPPDVLVQYQADEKNPWQYAWIHFHGFKSTEIVKSIGMTRKEPVYVPIEENSQLKDAVINLIMYKENEYACIGYMYILFDKMNRWTRHVEKKAGTNLRTMNYMREAIQYINTKYCESIMVQQIADHCGVDRAYLSKIFKYATGNTLQEYLIQFRIKRAKQLLKDTDLSVKYISYSVGYNDPFTFSKVFKKQEGVSPSVWRKKS